jgi:L-arabinokinase
MGLRLISHFAESAASRWNGYLANITPDEWRNQYRDHVPVEMNGLQFLARYHGTSDTVTRVDPTRVYAVRQPTEHPILENARVREFRRLLEGGAASEAVRLRLGALMYESHASYSACGLGSTGTDRLVELVHQAGAARGLYGAKITGGGSGGVVAVLARADSTVAIHEIAQLYAADAGRGGHVLGGSSTGAKACGVARLYSKPRHA